jgi:hypothetical protein
MPEAPQALVSEMVGETRLPRMSLAGQSFRTSDFRGIVVMLAAMAIFVVNDSFLKLVAQDLRPLMRHKIWSAKDLEALGKNAAAGGEGTVDLGGEGVTRGGEGVLGSSSQILKEEKGRTFRISASRIASN